MPDDDREKMFDRLMASQGPAELSATEALEQVGLLIDLSGDLAREEETTRALSMGRGTSARTNIRSPTLRC